MGWLALRCTGECNEAGRLCAFDRCGWGVLLSHLKSVHFHAVRALLFTDDAFCKDFFLDTGPVARNGMNRCHTPCSIALAFCKSLVSNPSVNQP